MLLVHISWSIVAAVHSPRCLNAGGPFGLRSAPRALTLQPPSHPGLEAAFLRMLGIGRAMIAGGAVAEVVFAEEDGLAFLGELAQLVMVGGRGGLVGIGGGDRFVDEVDEGGRDAGDDVFQGKGEPQGEADFLGGFGRAIPPFAGAFDVFGPGAHAKGFDGDHGGAAFGGHVEHLAPEIAEVILGEADREHDGVEVKGAHGIDGGAGAVGGEAEPLDFAFLASLDEGLDGAAGAEGALGIVGRDEMVELVEVEMVGLEAFERAFEFGAGAFLVAGLGFGGEDVVFALELFEGEAEFDFAFAVSSIGGGDIEVIQAAIEGVFDGGIRFFLVFVHEGEAGEGDERDFHFRAAEGAAGESGDAARDIVGGFEIGEQTVDADGGGGGGGTAHHAEEMSSFHGIWLVDSVYR
jgi:hypothetical protein